MQGIVLPTFRSLVSIRLPLKQLPPCYPSRLQNTMQTFLTGAVSVVASVCTCCFSASAFSTIPDPLQPQDGAFYGCFWLKVDVWVAVNIKELKHARLSVQKLHTPHQQTLQAPVVPALDLACNKGWGRSLRPPAKLPSHQLRPKRSLLPVSQAGEICL